MIEKDFWKDKKVFLTGHTGFKGSWLSLWLTSLGARVTGYALAPPTKPSLFELCNIASMVKSVSADIRDRETLGRTMAESSPDIVIHMAAQSLVRESYVVPVETYEINVIGTVNLMEAVRSCRNIKAVINVTTDKCYENREWVWGYRENEPLGGYDPYSSSKACSELVTSAYRNSFFHPDNYGSHGVGVATARAGNVIGGGDWAANRVVPDCVRAIMSGEEITLRNPGAIRPWQHVLEPLSGYLMLARKLYENGPSFSEAWNFGPDEADAKTVEWIVQYMCRTWGEGLSCKKDNGFHPHEANYLKLDSSKARARLGWRPIWNTEKAIESVVDWIRVYKNGGNIREVCFDQISDYSGEAFGK